MTGNPDRLLMADLADWIKLSSSAKQCREKSFGGRRGDRTPGLIVANEINKFTRRGAATTYVCESRIHLGNLGNQNIGRPIVKAVETLCGAELSGSTLGPEN
jgi:hypothetical protein